MTDALDLKISGDKLFVAGGDRGLIIFNTFTPLAGPALSFSSSLGLEASGFRVSIQGLPGLPVQIERSSNLFDWQSWTNAVLGSSPLEFLDSTASSNQFYRAFAR